MRKFSRRPARKNAQVFWDGHGKNSESFSGAHQKNSESFLDGLGEKSESFLGCPGKKFRKFAWMAGRSSESFWGVSGGKNRTFFWMVGRQKRQACGGLASTKSSSISITFLVGLMVQASPSCPFLLRPTCVEVEEQLSKKCCCIASR